MNHVRKYILLTLALLITISASGLSISIHTCCGKVKDFSLLGTDTKCKMHTRTTKDPSCAPKHSFNPLHKGKPCCSDQLISIQKTADATIYKKQVQERNAFDVLFVIKFVKNWLGFNSEQDEEDEPPVSVLSISKSLTILFRQFRI
ncbi:HYC_CC_PP family protein [Desertivirga xinjiangensis]|uniref:HYC_CC_PP family protein n=1 Tax=Desertivirga xinjiangensis TaxID=539206 RepID=UPI00210E0642|nr:hypothetical protein [Pedobacter xinjiangensis]